jgi:ABC-type branched-subunit amino acid transport system substrate-binding protein
MHRTTVYALFSALLSLALSLPVAAADIVIGQVLDQSGLGREISRDYFAGAKVYFDHINAQGGINGRRLSLKTRNDEGIAAKTVQLTAELVERENADVLFGYVGDANVTAAVTSPAFVRSGIALIGAVSGVAVGAAGADKVYFTRTTYAEEARRIIEHFRGTGISNFAIVYTPDDFGRSFRAVLVDSLKNNGLAALSDTAIPADSQAMAAVAARVVAKRPQVVVLLTDTLPAAAFIKAYRELDLGAVLVGTSLINARALLELAGINIAHGVVLTQVVPNPEKHDQPLLAEHARLLKQFLDEPPTHATLEGFIAAKTLVLALRGAGKSARRADIARAVKALRRADIGGPKIDFSADDNRGYAFVEVTFLRRDGRLLY